MRTVLFDVDGVIIRGMHSDPARWRRWDGELKADLGIEPDLLVERFFKGVFSTEVIVGRKSLIAALEETLPAVGFSGSPFSFVAYWFERDSELDLPLVEIARSLRECRSARLFLATNQEHLRAFHLWNGLGLRHIFEDILYSARLGVAKPDRAFFEQVDRRIGPQPEPPLLFDDSPAVIEAARAFGWEAVHVDDAADVGSHPWIRSMLDGPSRNDPGPE